MLETKQQFRFTRLALELVLALQLYRPVINNKQKHKLKFINIDGKI